MIADSRGTDEALCIQQHVQLLVQMADALEQRHGRAGATAHGLYAQACAIKQTRRVRTPLQMQPSEHSTSQAVHSTIHTAKGGESLIQRLPEAPDRCRRTCHGL